MTKKATFIFSILWILSLLLAGCAQATSTVVPPQALPTETSQPAASPTDTAQPPADTAIPTAEGGFNFEGVSLTLDSAIASGAQGEVVPENPGSAEGPYWETVPQYTRITLEGYPLEGTFFEPVIAVYPVEDFRRISPPAAGVLDSLQTLLQEQPAEAPDQLPLLPIFNAGQVFHSNVEYLDFQNGRGVRFLTLLAQYPAPVNNNELFYAFQGLTSDGRYAVSMILPVNHPSLPASADALSTADLEAIAQDYNTYRNETSAALEAQPPDSFTPGLEQLDALVASLQIEK